MNNLKQQVNDDFVSAFKARDKELKDAIGMLKTKITEIEKKAGTEATDTDVIAAAQSIVKQREQTIEILMNVDHYAKNLDNEIIRAKMEIKAMQKYLPQQLTSEQIKDEVIEVLKDMIFPPEQASRAVGAIMNYFKKNFNGQYNPKELKEIVDEILKR